MQPNVRILDMLARYQNEYAKEKLKDLLVNIAKQTFETKNI